MSRLFDDKLMKEIKQDGGRNGGQNECRKCHIDVDLEDSDDEYFIGNGINQEVNIDHDNLDSRLNLELG